MTTIYITTNPDNSIASWASAKGMDSEIAVEVTDDHAFFSDNPFLYTYENGQLIKSDSITLTMSKTQKINELNTACNTSILGKFSYTYNGVAYQFSNDTSAQANFDKVMTAFDKGMITSIGWTAFDSTGAMVRLAFDATSYTDLYRAHLNHIQANISEFRDTLQPQVEQATTVDAVTSIQWTGVN